MGKKPRPSWHLHDDLQDCGSHRWLFALDERTVMLVDEPGRSLLRGAEPRPVAVEPRQFDMLMVLLRRHAQVVTKDELRSLLWGDRAVGEHVLTKCVSKLRLSLDASLGAQTSAGAFDGAPPFSGTGPSASWLVTVYGNGYRLRYPPHCLPQLPGAGAEAPPTARERRHAQERLAQWLARHRYPADLPASVHQVLAGYRAGAATPAAS